MDAASARPKGIALRKRQRIAWLRLIAPTMSAPPTFRDLLHHFRLAQTALSVLSELSSRGGAMRATRIATEAEAHRELEPAQIRHPFVDVIEGAPLAEGTCCRPMFPSAPGSSMRWADTGRDRYDHPAHRALRLGGLSRFCLNLISAQGCTGIPAASSPLRWAIELPTCSCEARRPRHRPSRSDSTA